MNKVAFLTIVVLFCLSMFTSGAEAALGDGCSVNANCTDANSECISSACACSTGYAESGGVCGTAVDSLGGDCSGGGVCTVENSECSNDVCACKAENEEKDGECIEGFASPPPPVFPDLDNGNMTCTTDEEKAECDLILNAYCNPGTDLCECEPGYYKANSSCLAVLGRDCDTDASCILHLANTACLANVCECSTQYFVSGAICSSESSAESVKAQSLFATSLLVLACYLF